MPNVFDNGVRIVMTRGAFSTKAGAIVGTLKTADGTEWLEVLLDDYETPVRCRTFMLQLEERIDDEEGNIAARATLGM
jgi:hypothetical protein